LYWAESSVKPKAALAYQGKGVQKAGDHCKWCKVKAQCSTLAAANLKIARREFKDDKGKFKSPHLLTDQQLLDIYEKLDLLTDWASAVRSHMLKTAIDGKKWPGYKIVQGRSNRKWLNEDKVIKYLKDQSYDEDEFINRKLKGITDIEKLLGKDVFANVTRGLVEKPPGKPTFVPESDKRPAMGSTESALEDFS